MKKIQKYWFIQDWGTYNNETLVVVGYTFDEVVRIMERNDFDKKIIEEFKDSDIKGCMNPAFSGLVLDFSNGATILWFAKFDIGDWDCFDVLAHECLHLVQRVLIKHRGIEDEEEAHAYQLEYLIKGIRTKIFEKVKKNNKNKKMKK